MKLLYILLILITACIILEVFNFNTENFIVLEEDTSIPYDCPDYIYTDGTHYYLYNSKKLVDGVNNPKKFNTINEAQDYWKSLKCPRIPKVDLVIKKKKDDPTVTYERGCNLKISPNDYEYEKYSYYSDSLKDIRKYQEKVDANPEKYELDSCMLNEIRAEHPELIDDTNEAIDNYFSSLENFVGHV